MKPAARPIRSTTPYCRVAALASNDDAVIIVMMSAGATSMPSNITARSRPFAFAAACAFTPPCPTDGRYTTPTPCDPTHDVTAPPTWPVALSVATTEYVARAVADASTSAAISNGERR